MDQFGTNWQTVGYWAALRAAVRLAHDGGKNFLRISRAAPLGFKYWEIGNECHGLWETDINAVPHDPYTYGTRARDYLNLMKAVDSTIKIGVVVTPGEGSYSNNANHYAINPRAGTANYGWTPVLLATLKNLGVTPDFAIHHRYAEWTDSNNPRGSDSDAFLLQRSTQWALDATDLRQQLTDYFSPAGTNVELVCTENNRDSGAQGKQSTSLVNGLYHADSLGQLMQTEFNGLIWWDLRNGTDASGCFDSTLYGWLVSLTGFLPCPTATVRSYGIPQADAVRTNAPAAAQDIATNTLAGAGTSFSYSFPALSLALFTFAPAAPSLAILPPAPQPGGQFVFQLQGQPGVRYYVQNPTNLGAWTTVSTNRLTGTTLNLMNPVPTQAAISIWRAVWQP